MIVILTLQFILILHYASGSCILLIGGADNSSISWDAAGTCDPFNSDPPPLSGLGSRAAILGDNLITCGGIYAGKACYSASLQDSYRTWTKMAEMSSLRHGHTLTAVGNQLVAAGGFGDVPEIDSVEIFSGDQWREAGWKLLEGLSGHCTVAASDTEIIVIGGRTGDDSWSDKMTKYNVETGESTELATLPQPFWSHACYRFQDYIYVTGGWKMYSSDALADTLRYDINLEEWLELPEMPKGRESHGMVVTEDGVYVLGGWNQERSVMLLSNNTWEDVKPGLQFDFSYGSSLLEL